MPTATYNSYTPSKGLKIPKADYIIQQNLNETDVHPGYCQFGGPGSNVLVTLKWKKTMEARTKHFKPAHAVKKYIDGFFNPWDLQGLTSGSLAGMTGDKKEIFEALELFATSEFGFNSTQFNRIINTKAGTSRRAMNVNFPDYAVPKRKKFIP
ncbi:uncharacterized protein LOC132717298 [Ruditapes philippinarum]|uniref:uncharacterized protein LOC132717298 n=1 Tax=Ruditapes philippinarum TaxID=129788 RepID=UPI00295B5161|nr:uncharacterized protein LOC132717298 [Ruditapes philippinarum]